MLKSVHTDMHAVCEDNTLTRLRRGVLMEEYGWFDGQDAKVVYSAGTTNVYYGGIGTPDGPGHGHVKATGGPLGENIVYWRLPSSEGGQVIVSNAWDLVNGNDLRDYLTIF